MVGKLSNVHVPDAKLFMSIFLGVANKCFLRILCHFAIPNFKPHFIIIKMRRIYVFNQKIN